VSSDDQDPDKKISSNSTPEDGVAIGSSAAGALDASEAAPKNPQMNDPGPGPVAPNPSSDSAPDSKPAPKPGSKSDGSGFGWIGRSVALVVLLILAAVGTLYVCAKNSDNAPRLIVTASPTAPKVDPCRLGDCYTALTVIQTASNTDPATADSPGFCCRYVAEPRPLGAGSISAKLDDATILLGASDAKLAIGARTGRQATWHRVAPNAAFSVTLSASTTTTLDLPLLDRAVAAGFLSVESAGTLSQRIGSLADRLFPAAPSPTTDTIPVPALGGQAAASVDYRDGRPVKILLKTATKRSLLFGQELTSSTGGLGFLDRLVTTRIPTPSEIGERILGLARGRGFTGLTDQGGEQLLEAFETFALEPPVEARGFAAVCTGFYGVARTTLNRFDAAVLTYLAARRSALFTHPQGKAGHPCTDDGKPGMSADLGEAWLALAAPIPETQGLAALQAIPAPLVSLSAAEETDDKETKGAAQFARDLAATAKRGQHVGPGLLGRFPKALTLRVGGIRTRIGRDAVKRFLIGGWIHAGCWSVLPALDGQMTTLFIEAQFPYLNQLRLSLNKEGGVREMALAGVTYADLVVEQRLNKGTDCRQFLSAERMAAYRDWLAVGGPTERTPLDHAIGLLTGTGSGAALKLPQR
jgi:hypothetical protein